MGLRSVERAVSSATGGGPIRRTVDVAAAAVLLLVLSPLLLVGVVTVAATCGRPIFFGHRRLGRHGRPFRCWKLRTMTVDAERQLDLDPALRDRHRSNGYKLPNGADPRVTRCGRWLRRTYLDEIPQLFNVLVGDMSLVGPRPIVPAELGLFGEEGSDLLTMKPGIFGAWNSMGRQRPPYPVRADLELEYVRSRTALSDLVILARSVVAVLQGQGDE